MRRRLVRLMALAVVAPLVARGTVVVAERLETANGPSTASRSLRSAGRLANRFSWRR